MVPLFRPREVSNHPSTNNRPLWLRRSLCPSLDPRIAAAHAERAGVTHKIFSAGVPSKRVEGRVESSLRSRFLQKNGCEGDKSRRWLVAGTGAAQDTLQNASVCNRKDPSSFVEQRHARLFRNKRKRRMAKVVVHTFLLTLLTSGELNTSG